MNKFAIPRILNRYCCHLSVRSSIKFQLNVITKSTCGWRILGTGQRFAHTFENVAKGEKSVSSDDNDFHEPVFIEKPVTHKILISELQKCCSVEDQMKTLCSVLSLTPEDLKQRYSLCNLVASMMQPFFEEGFKVQLFGSSVNGFGFKGCDMDMAFNSCSNYTEMRSSCFDDCDIPSIVDVLNGNVSRSFMSKLSPKDQLVFLHTVFLDYYKETATAPQFINAYVPIIRFLHDRYELKCDLSCANWSAFGNTKLLRFYGRFDERVTPLMMTVRYWAKNAGLIGGGLVFNTYTLCLLVIFFLQTRTPPILPAAQDVLNLSDFFMNEDMGDEGYSKLVSQIAPSKNTENIEELLREFFMYYLYFDFTHVITPLTACSWPRNKFFADEKNKRFRISTICVQDPTRKSHNVANLADYKHCRKFGLDMLHSCKVFRDRHSYQPSSEPWGLVRLFDTDHDRIFGDQSLLPKYYQANLKLRLSSESSSDLDSVRTKAIKTVLKIFEDVLLFDCETVSFSENLRDYSEANDLILLSKCVVNIQHNTWTGRSQVEMSDFPDEVWNSTMDLERAISLKLQELENAEMKVYMFQCKFFLSEDNESLIVRFTSPDRDCFNPVLGMFLQGFVQKLFYNAF